MSIEAPHSKPGLVPQPTTAVAAVSPDAIHLTAWRDPTAVLAAVRQLAASPDPAAVLTSLAAVCAPAIADECWGTILQEGVTQPISIAVPARAEQFPTPATWMMPLAGGDQLTLSFSQSVWEHYPEFSGTMSWRWHDRDRPTRSDKVIAQLLLDRALELVRAQRLEAALAVERDKAVNLQLALESSREIGQAIGILMATYKVTSQQGFDLLRTASQHTHRKLREVATDVCDTGMLVLPAPRSSPARSAGLS
ncbi:MAG: ANTAR domain-containing protein [Jatrophihabitantaceae bacterium]